MEGIGVVAHSAPGGSAFSFANVASADDDVLHLERCGKLGNDVPDMLSHFFLPKLDSPRRPT